VAGKWGRSSLSDTASGLARRGDGKHTPDGRACQRFGLITDPHHEDWAPEESGSLDELVESVELESLVASAAGACADASPEVSAEAESSPVVADAVSELV
jgi:hypothetical protein